MRHLSLALPSDKGREQSYSRFGVNKNRNSIEKAPVLTREAQTHCGAVEVTRMQHKGSVDDNSEAPRLVGDLT